MVMTKDKKVELDRTHTQGKGCERLFYCIRVDPRRSEGGGGGGWRAKKGEVEELGSSQSGSTGQKVLDQKAWWSYASTGMTRLYGDDDDGSGLFGNLGLYIFVRRSKMAYKRGRGR